MNVGVEVSYHVIKSIITYNIGMLLYECRIPNFRVSGLRFYKMTGFRECRLRFGHAPHENNKNEK